MAWIDHDRDIRGGHFEMLMDHVRISFVSDACLQRFELSGNKKFDQMDNRKQSRSGHDEMLLARIATVEHRMRPSLFSFDFKVKQLYIDNNNLELIHRRKSGIMFLIKIKLCRKG